MSESTMAATAAFDLGRVLRQGLSWRPQLTLQQLTLAASLYFAAFSNTAFFHGVAATGALDGWHGALIAACLFAAIAALNMLLLSLVLTRWTAKPLLTLLLLVTALAVHFMREYTVYLDTDMLRNILHTQRSESAELVSPGLILPFIGYGVVPALLLWRVRIRRRTPLRALLVRGLGFSAALIVAAGAILLAFQDLSALMRNHRELRHLVTPANYLVALTRVVIDEHAAEKKPLAPIGLDARVVPRRTGARPRLLVLVVGETVRAQNWGLNGYARQTTPQLAARAPLNFTDVSACGSSTEVSLPCMFSVYGRTNHDARRIKQSQSLLHVLDHAGIATLWRDNQTGCKGVCEGLPYESFDQTHDSGACDEDSCLDEILLRGLSEKVAAQPGDSVIVLHQLGNHGPSYFKRYPARLRRFTPTCDTPDLGHCTREEILNAYDNAILYTDELLAHTIDLLASMEDRDTALIYLSDHGESLGEGGLYLHGVPYAIAPATQLRVPMLVWLSPSFALSRGIDFACLRSFTHAPISHDNLFHSVLGLMQVHTAAYVATLDLFGPCTHAT